MNGYDDLIRELLSNDADRKRKACKPAAAAICELMAELAAARTVLERTRQWAVDAQYHGLVCELDADRMPSPSEMLVILNDISKTIRGEMCPTCGGKGMTIWNSTADECPDCGGTGKKEMTNE